MYVHRVSLRRRGFVACTQTGLIATATKQLDDSNLELGTANANSAYLSCCNIRLLVFLVRASVCRHAWGTLSLHAQGNGVHFDPVFSFRCRVYDSEQHYGRPERW